MQDECAIQCQGVWWGRRARTLGPCAAGDSRWAVSPSGHQGPLYQHMASQPGACTCQGCFRHAGSVVRGCSAGTCSRSSAVPRLLPWFPGRCGCPVMYRFEWERRATRLLACEESGRSGGRSRMRSEGDRATPTASGRGLRPVFSAGSTTMDSSTSGLPVGQAAFGQYANRESVSSGPTLRELPRPALSRIRLGERQDLCPDVPACRLRGIQRRSPMDERAGRYGGRRRFIQTASHRHIDWIPMGGLGGT